MSSNQLKSAQPVVGRDSDVNPTPPSPPASRPSLNGQHGPAEEFHIITDIFMIPASLTALCFEGTVRGFSFIE